MKKILILVFIPFFSFSQELKTKFNWHNLDLKEDVIRGMRTEKAYRELLKDRKYQTNYQENINLIF